MTNDMMKKVLVKGAGEQASAVAHRLYRSGFRVVSTEIAKPTAIRRLVSFAEAIYSGELIVEGVKGIAYTLDNLMDLETFDWSHIPIVVDPKGALIERWQPDVIVDARIMKRNLDNKIDDAPLTIGLGPGIEAGKDVHYIVETNRGHHLGRIIEKGFSSPNTGVPGTVMGYSKERVLRSPANGMFRSIKKLADTVQQGDLIAKVGEEPVIATISGIIRGLTHDGIEVHKGQKIGDIDPRHEPSNSDTISDKARTISGAVLEIIMHHYFFNFPLSR